MQQVKAVVALAKGEPVQLTTINVPDPGPGEAVVKVQACGVCHTDLHYREGGINDDFPFLLGHEGGADVVIDAVGRPETWKQAFYARDLAGTVVLVGVPTPDMKVPDIPLIDVFGRGGSLKSSWYGDCLPSRDFPMLVELYQQGRLDLDAFVSEEIGLGDVEAAFEKMHHAPDGQSVLRSVVVL